MKLPGIAERALLAQLLLSPGRTIPATMLVDRLWSESTLPVDPMNALQIRVSKLRRALKAMGVGDVVTREGVGYRATIDSSTVDALEFADRVRAARAAAASAADNGGVGTAHVQAYDDALALWRGDPLSDFAVEQWATAESARLSELRLAALTERAQLALTLGRHLEVVGDLEPVVAQDPTSESLAGLLMLALYRGGRQADALDVYSRTQEVLDESLGLEPSVSLRSLHLRVLRQDATLGAQQDMVPAAAAVADGAAATTIPVTMPAHRSRAEADRTAPTNLPTVVRPLIGRDAQLESIVELLGGVRLLTLVGPGGAGKTSLAITTVVRTSAEYLDGAFGVRLASVTTPDQVPVAVADAVGMPMDGAGAARNLRDRLISFLARRRMLLLVDNCEHVVDAVAALVDDILGRCPDITVIATSREALAIPDEVQVTVGPLEIPPEDTSAGDVLAYPAAQLFAERARAVRPGLLFGARDLAAIGAITRSLDGIPLALELAAARVSTLSPAEVSERLANRFTLLTSGARTAEARQQTLRATVDWSYQLLSEAEQRVFDRLSVFQGGWTLMSAEGVVADEGAPPGEVLDTIGRLVERSMVVAEPGPTTRYRMLETLRQYAAEQLEAYGQTVEVARRHAAYFRGIVEHAEVALRGHEQRQTLLWLRAEQPNIRAALAFLGGPDGDRDGALMMAGSLGMFWHLGRHLEGRQVLARLVVGDEGSPAARALALQAISIVERPRGCLVHPNPGCADAAAESLALFEELGDTWHAALSRVLLAVEGVTGAEPERSEALLAAAQEQFDHDGDPWGPAVIGFVRMETAAKTGDVDAAIRIGRTTAAAFRQLDDSWGLSATLYHLGWALRQFGRYAEGAPVLEEAIDVARGAGLWNTAQWALADLAIAKVHLGDYETARRLFDEGAAASREVGDSAGEVLAGYGYGLLAHVDGDWGEARRHYEVALDGFIELATPVLEGVALVGLGRCDEADGDTAAARARYSEALGLGRRLGEPAVTASALEGLGRLAFASGDRDDAAVRCGEAAAIRERLHRPAPPHERADSRTSPTHCDAAT
ncbi:BTAD domain-containing putative transcriptional regulator [Nocardioides sp. CN2-186]|uniref:BTAD domain-containing putative transcriptional regulator n=1 Tax=Nocardioides tweenelious TaxID=3156607 RepID=UPI0032B3DEC4